MEISIMNNEGKIVRTFREMRKRDPFMDRRSGEDRRKVYSLEYFQAGNPDRRKRNEQRSNVERRADCVRISSWSSVCPDYEDDDYQKGRVRITAPVKNVNDPEQGA